MERAIIGAPAFRRRLRFVPLLVLLSVCQTAVYAQLSDEAVLEYALEGRRNGKSEHQIGRELLARGVTAEQAERLKRKYEESQGSEVRVADRGISGQQRERVQSSSERLTAGSLDVVSSAATDPAADRSDPREVFGRDVFRSRTLTFEPNENQATPSNYRLGPGDEVIIDIWGENERSLREEISPEGNIMVEQVGPVYLNGLTIGEANAKLRGLRTDLRGGLGRQSRIGSAGYAGAFTHDPGERDGRGRDARDLPSVVVFDGLPCAVPRWRGYSDRRASRYRRDARGP